MNRLDQSKYPVQQIFESTKASPSAQSLVRALHQELMNESHRKPIARTHSCGITYLYDDRKAFVFVNVRRDFVSLKFFTGHSTIDGLGKGNWLNRGDNLGSKTYRLADGAGVKRAVRFAIKAHEIAADWAQES